jgi:hypothetical protein
MHLRSASSQCVGLEPPHAYEFHQRRALSSYNWSWKQVHPEFPGDWRHLEALGSAGSEPQKLEAADETGQEHRHPAWRILGGYADNSRGNSLLDQ